MTLLGAAAVAMWWDIDPAINGEFQDWHSHEHFRERMSIPGFQRGSRWESQEGGSGFFVLYELEKYETLVSPGYLARLNDPTPWSRKMMPHHRNMVRSQCRVLETFGGGIARFMTTIRFVLEAATVQDVRCRIQSILAELSTRAGITGAHLLQTVTPQGAPTTEQKIRGGDQVADGIILLSGYDHIALRKAACEQLGDEVLRTAGSIPSITSHFSLADSFSRADDEKACRKPEA